MRTLCFLVAVSLCRAACGQTTYDVVVYGGTSAGVTAAIQTARMGKTAVLIEPGRHLGGLTSGGLGATDIGNKQAIGGMSREFYARVRSTTIGPKRGSTRPSASIARSAARLVDDETMWGFEPHVAEQYPAGNARRGEACPSMLGERSTWPAASARQGPRIAAIVMESGQEFRGRMFIDATYEGDLMAKAGVSYTVGREPNARYGETLNGVQVARRRPPPVHQAGRSLRAAGRSGERPACRAFRPAPPGEDGQGDRRVQAYCFRMCTTDVPENRRPWPKPEDYDPLRYELLLRNFEAGDLRMPVEPDGHAQPQDRHQQQLRHLDRQHRHELRLSRGRLRRAGADHRASTRPTRRA